MKTIWTILMLFAVLLVPVLAEENATNHAPLITSQPVVQATVGQQYTYTVVATDQDVNDTITYSLVINPQGMIIDANTGVIAWLPSQTGVVSVQVQATDNHDAFYQQNFSITVSTTVPSLTISSIELGSSTQEREQSISGTFTVRNSGTATITNINLSSTLATKYGVQFLNIPSQLAAGQEATITLLLTIPDDQDSGRRNIGQVSVIGQSTQDVTAQASVYLTTESNLEIQRITIENDDTGDSDRVSDDGDEVKVKPGDSITMTVKIKNIFGDDIDIENIEVNVDSDSDLDFDDSDDASDLGKGDTDEIMFSFTIDSDIDEDTYTVTVDVDGEDENGARHDDSLTFDVKVDRESNEISITNVLLTPDSISCERKARLDVTIENTGSRDQSKVTLEVNSDDLDFYKRIQNIELDSNDDVKKSFDVIVPSSVQPGEYLIEINTYYDTNKDSESDVALLTVAQCGQTSPPVVPPQDDTTNLPEQPPIFTNPVYGQEQAMTFSEVNPWYIGLLIVVAILLLVLIILLIAKMFM
ncbi:MAG: putative Ig domain-containing protein [archaeon]